MFRSSILFETHLEKNFIFIALKIEGDRRRENLPQASTTKHLNEMHSKNS